MGGDQANRADDAHQLGKDRDIYDIYEKSLSSIMVLRSDDWSPIEIGLAFGRSKMNMLDRTVVLVLSVFVVSGCFRSGDGGDEVGGSRDTGDVVEGADTASPTSDASPDATGDELFADIESSGGYGTVTFGNGYRAIEVRTANGFDLCEAYRSEDTSGPDDARVLRVVVGATEPGIYPIADRTLFSGETDQAHVFFVVRFPNGAATFPVVDGQVEVVEGYESDDQSVEVRVDAEVPRSPKGFRTCSGSPVSCQCKSLAGETFNCEADGESADQCCLESRGTTETVDFERTITATHCSAYDDSR